MFNVVKNVNQTSVVTVAVNILKTQSGGCYQQELCPQSSLFQLQFPLCFAVVKNEETNMQSTARSWIQLSFKRKLIQQNNSIIMNQYNLNRYRTQKMYMKYTLTVNIMPSDE
ncbi:Hypothetical_protein [Hexamita inflata]|uniref:Hypothetical_protein n=1 Tax=Hexamita inflata TaxID=28002 RepID=A0ABP1I8F9_9EUKA